MTAVNGSASQARDTGAPRRGPVWHAIRGLFDVASRVAPGFGPRLQRGLIRTAYWLVSALERRGDTTFMNYGYAHLDTGGQPLPGDHGDDSYSVRLYHRVASARDLTGLDVLEVGSGRGGGAAFVMRHLGPASMTGMDFAATAIRFCRRRHRVDGLKFEQGDAEHLPFADRSFDAVINVESSHCYPSFENFLREVDRVLRPGGHFLFADLRHRQGVSTMRAALAERFEIVDEESITANVFRALELDSDRRRRMIETRAPRLLHRALGNFSSVRGSATFSEFASGNFQYWRFVLRKRASDSQPLN